MILGLLLTAGILLAGVAACLVWMLAARRTRTADPLHVRLHVAHEGADSGDITVEGWQVAERRDSAGNLWLVVDRATLLETDGRRVTLEGQTDILARRVILREHLVDVAVRLPLMVGEAAA